MALETLRPIGKINDVQLAHYENGNVYMDGETPPGGPYVEIDHDKNVILFRIQKGPIKEVGLNGCQVDTLIGVAASIIEGLNKNFPCAENDEALMHLVGAIQALAKRKTNREARGVEGTNQA